jgi:hypothetical protein
MVFVEGGPHQTAITLADGNRVTVHETPEELAATVMRFRAAVLVVADELAVARGNRGATTSELAGEGAVTDGARSDFVDDLVDTEEAQPCSS